MNGNQRKTGVLLYEENYRGLTRIQQTSGDSRNKLINEAVEFWLKNRLRQSFQQVEGGQKDAN